MYSRSEAGIEAEVGMEVDFVWTRFTYKKERMNGFFSIHILYIILTIAHLSQEHWRLSTAWTLSGIKYV